MRNTNVFTVLNEDTMTIATQTIERHNRTTMAVLPAIFETKKDADEWASHRLEMWSVVKSNFNHKWIEHTQNTKPVITKVEMGGSIDTDSNNLFVTVKFAKWTMLFEWTINNKTNWVHTNAEPTHLDGVEIEEIEEKFCVGGGKFSKVMTNTELCQTGKDANAIIKHFGFDDDMFGVEIENRKHHIS